MIAFSYEKVVTPSGVLRSICDLAMLTALDSFHFETKYARCRYPVSFGKSFGKLLRLERSLKIARKLQVHSYLQYHQ